MSEKQGLERSDQSDIWLAPNPHSTLLTPFIKSDMFFEKANLVFSFFAFQI